MQLLTSEQIRSALIEQWQTEPSEAATIAALAAGRMGWAVQAVEDEDLLAERSTQLATLTSIPGLSKVQRFDLAQKMSGEKVEDLLELWLLWWRDVMLAANGCLELTANIDMRDLLQQHASRFGSLMAEQMIRAILRTREAIEQNVNGRVALEVLMLDIPMLAA
jgi:DNA polymerase-3 subunit delta'